MSNKGSFNTSVKQAPNDQPEYNRPTVNAAYTTQACNCTVVSHNVVVKAVYVVAEDNAYKIPTPKWNVKSCFGSKLTGFQISALPTKGKLRLNGTPISLNDVISNADFSKLVYTLETETAGDDVAKFKVVVACGTSTEYTITFQLSEYVSDPCVNCK